MGANEMHGKNLLGNDSEIFRLRWAISHLQNLHSAQSFWTLPVKIVESTTVLQYYAIIPFEG